MKTLSNNTQAKVLNRYDLIDNTKAELSLLVKEIVEGLIVEGEKLEGLSQSDKHKLAEKNEVEAQYMDTYIDAVMVNGLKGLSSNNLIITYNTSNRPIATLSKKVCERRKLTINRKEVFEYGLNLNTSLNDKKAIAFQVLKDLIHLIGFNSGEATASNSGKTNNKNYYIICNILGIECEKITYENSKNCSYRAVKVKENGFAFKLLNNLKSEYTPLTFNIKNVEKKTDKKSADKKEKPLSQRDKLIAFVKKYESNSKYKSILEELKQILKINL